VAVDGEPNSFASGLVSARFSSSRSSVVSSGALRMSCSRISTPRSIGERGAGSAANTGSSAATGTGALLTDRRANAPAEPFPYVNHAVALSASFV
jgi:hypothetical protein